MVSSQCKDVFQTKAHLKSSTKKKSGTRIKKDTWYNDDNNFSEQIIISKDLMIPQHSYLYKVGERQLFKQKINRTS